MIDPNAYAITQVFDATIAKGLCVKRAAANHVAASTASTDVVLGVTGDLSTTSGNNGPVIVSGPAKVLYSGTITAGQLVSVYSDSGVVACTRHTHTENTAGSYTQNATTGAAAADYAVGRALEDGAAGEYHLIWVGVSQV